MLLIRTNFDCIILDSCDACEDNLKDLFAAIQADDELLDKLDEWIVDAMDCDGEKKNILCDTENSADFWYQIGSEVIFTEGLAQHICSTFKDKGACR